MNYKTTETTGVKNKKIQNNGQDKSEDVSQMSEVQTGLAKAKEASFLWRSLSFDARAKHMLAVKRLLIKNLDEVVDTVTAETGKISTEVVVNEVLVVSELISYYAKHAKEILATRKVSSGLLRHKRAEKRYEPLGVIGIISPWNYPLTLSLGPVSTALFAGNTVVLKPSEITPSVGVLIGKLFSQMSEYSDIVQVVTGDGKVGEELVRSGVDKIAFTGSVATGKAVMRAASDSLTPVLLELGGKDPMIVCSDADLDRAANAAVWGAFTNAGQTCMAVERVYVVKEVYDEFVDKVIKATSKVHQGTGGGSDIGAVTHQGQMQIIERHLADALSKGAEVVYGGSKVMVGNRPSLQPTVLVGVDHSMQVMTEETFGPILPIMEVEDVAEALWLANDTPFGLNSSVWTSDTSMADKLVSGLQSGTVCVNDCMVSYAMPALAFGGVKSSGMGRSHGPEGLREFSQLKSVAYDRLGVKKELHWLPLPKSLERSVRLALKMRHG